jgi:hypothetical protein
VLRIVRNRTLTFVVTAYETYVSEGNAGNVVFDFTGWTVRSQVRDARSNALVCNLNVTFPVPTNGQVVIQNTRDFTHALKDRSNLWFDIVATDAADKDHVIYPATPTEIVTYPTDPNDPNPSFLPGNGVYAHTHQIADVTGLQAALNTIPDVSVLVPADELEIVQGGVTFYIPLIRR